MHLDGRTRNVWLCFTRLSVSLRCRPVFAGTSAALRAGSRRATSDADTRRDAVSDVTTVGGSVQTELAQETGNAIQESFAEDSRASRIVGMLSYTATLLLINRGASGFQVLLNEYFNQSPGKPSNFRESEAFGEFLRKQKLSDAHLYEVMDFELGVMRMHANSL